MNVNQNTRPSESLFRFQEALVALLRTRLNVSMGAVGLLASVTLGKLVWGAIIFVLFLNVFLFGNIALGLYLGSVFGETFYGFGILTLGYLALIIVFVLVRGLLQSRVQNAVARVAVQSLDKVNAKLDDVSSLRVIPEYREVVLRSAVRPVEALERRVLESSRRAAQAQAEVLRQVDYLRLNYKRVAADMAEQRLTEKVPAYRFVAGFINRTLDRQDERKRLASSKPKPSFLGLSSNRFIDKILEKSSAILPYTPLIMRIVSPVLTAALVSKSQGWLAKLLGLKKKKR